MGVTIFKVERVRFATGEHIGEMSLIVPSIETQINIGTGEFTLEQLLQFPDFPIEVNILSNSKYIQDVKSFGFNNALNIEDFNGERWVLNNGNYYEIEGSRFRAFRAVDGKQLFDFSVSTNWNGPTMPMWIVGDKEGTVNPINMPNGKIYFYNTTPIPEVISNETQFYKGATPIFSTTDPYGDGGVSGGGGGTGNFDGTGDDIEIPSLPTLSAVDAGFITLFNPTLVELNNLSSYMWSNLFDISGWRKIFADPMQAILGLSIVPVNVPASGEKKPVKVGNISTNVSMTVALSQYVEVDCGTLNVNEFWGAYLDYDPYTKAEIYLPYIGTHPLATDDIMNKSVHVIYHVDILSGACCAYVKCGGSVLYSFIGQCASSIPITGDNWTNVINGAINIAGAIGSMVATGGASAPMEIGQIASTAVNQMKPSVEKSGAMGGTGGMLGVQTPYLILTRPRQALPRDQNAFIGYPSFITENLGSLSGYTEIDSIHLENVPATEPELTEIESILKSGVIF